MPTHIAARLAVAAVTLTLSTGLAQSPTLKSVMATKVVNTEGLLKPLVTSDFAGLDRYAERLGRLSFAEVSSWQARPEADYLAQATAFVEAVRGLREAAAARDTNKASASYTRLVSSCLGCHRYVKQGRSASLRQSQVPPVRAAD